MTSNVVDLAAYRKSKQEAAAPTASDPRLVPAVTSDEAWATLQKLQQTQAFLIDSLERLNQAQACLVNAKAACEKIEEESTMVQNAILSGDIAEMERAKAELLRRHGK